MRNLEARCVVRARSGFYKLVDRLSRRCEPSSCPAHVVRVTWVWVVVVGSLVATARRLIKLGVAFATLPNLPPQSRCRSACHCACGVALDEDYIALQVEPAMQGACLVQVGAGRTSRIPLVQRLGVPPQLLAESRDELEQLRQAVVEWHPRLVQPRRSLARAIDRDFGEQKGRSFDSTESFGPRPPTVN